MTKLFRLPGLIDTHVHLREPGATQKEDFETGSKAAIVGGFTMVLDMPNNPIATVSSQALQEKENLAKGRIFCDVGFYFGASKDSIQYFNQVAGQVYGLKVYMNQTTGDLLIENDEVLAEIFSTWPKEKVLMVHAEGETLKKAISLAKKFGNKLHVAHVSLKNEIEQIKAAKAEKMKITCEVTPHHLFLTDQDVKKLGGFGMMKPPLETEDDQKALWQGIEDGTIDIIGSDHAPHTKEEKQGEKPAYGVPNLETTLPLMLTAVSNGKLSLERLIELAYTSPRKIFGLPEEKDTYVEVDLGESYVIDDKNLQTKCGWTPFAGMEVKGKVKKVVLHGQTVFDGQKILGPYGQILKSA